jgi:hypothetical protein
MAKFDPKNGCWYDHTPEEWAEVTKGCIGFSVPGSLASKMARGHNKKLPKPDSPLVAKKRQKE